MTVNVDSGKIDKECELNRNYACCGCEHYYDESDTVCKLREWVDKTDISKGTHVIFKSQIFAIENLRNHEIGEDEVYAWSLAALLGVFPILERKGYQKAMPQLLYNVAINKWIVDSHVYTTDAYDNPIDACVSMIEYLHELKIL